MAQWIKDPVLSLQWLGLLLWHRFDPWPRNFCRPWAWPKKKKKEEAEGWVLSYHVTYGNWDIPLYKYHSDALTKKNVRQF